MEFVRYDAVYGVGLSGRFLTGLTGWFRYDPVYAVILSKKQGEADASPTILSFHQFINKALPLSPTEIGRALPL